MKTQERSQRKDAEAQWREDEAKKTRVDFFCRACPVDVMMGEFFKGWRKKAGLLTLVVAVLFIVGWLRHPLNKDAFSFAIGLSRMTIASNQNGLWWVKSDLPGLFYQPPRLEGASRRFSLPGTTMAFSEDPFAHLFYWDWTTHWRWDLCGFHFAQYRQDNPMRGIRLSFWIIPHWAVVWPLTMISSYLLFSKSHRTGPKLASTVDSEEVKGAPKIFSHGMTLICTDQKSISGTG